MWRPPGEHVPRGRAHAGNGENEMAIKLSIKFHPNETLSILYMHRCHHKTKQQHRRAQVHQAIVIHRVHAAP
jgi:hypothetical protein